MAFRLIPTLALVILTCGSSAVQAQTTSARLACRAYDSANADERLKAVVMAEFDFRQQAVRLFGTNQSDEWIYTNRNSDEMKVVSWPNGEISAHGYYFGSVVGFQFLPSESK